MKKRSVQVYCEYCKKNVIEIVFEDDIISSKENLQYEDELREMVEHFHWINNHRRCAICGMVVQGKDIDVLDRKEIKRIHQLYLNETMPREADELLTVHKKCLKK